MAWARERAFSDYMTSHVYISLAIHDKQQQSKDRRQKSCIQETLQLINLAMVKFCGYEIQQLRNPAIMKLFDNEILLVCDLAIMELKLWNHELMQLQKTYNLNTRFLTFAGNTENLHKPAPKQNRASHFKSVVVRDLIKNSGFQNCVFTSTQLPSAVQHGLRNMWNHIEHLSLMSDSTSYREKDTTKNYALGQGSPHKHYTLCMDARS